MASDRHCSRRGVRCLSSLTFLATKRSFKGQTIALQNAPRSHASQTRKGDRPPCKCRAQREAADFQDPLPGRRPFCLRQKHIPQPRFPLIADGTPPPCSQSPRRILESRLNLIRLGNSRWLRLVISRSGWLRAAPRRALTFLFLVAEVRGQAEASVDAAAPPLRRQTVVVNPSAHS